MTIRNDKKRKLFYLDDILVYPQDQLALTIQHLPWFRELRPAQLEKLARIATMYHLQAGDILYREGDRDNTIYVLLEGQVALEMEVPTRGQSVYYMAELLDIIGWSSLTPIVRQRIARARATQTSLVLGLDGKLLQQVCDEDNQIGYIVFRRLANVVANRFLKIRLHLMEMIMHPVDQEIH